MKVLVSRSTAAEIFGEIQRWVEHGLRVSGVPLESLLYPLSAMVPARGAISPLELARLDRIRELVVDGVAIPPDAVKAFSPANCHFAAEDLGQASREFNAAIDRLLEGRPRLAVLSKLHSHPFAGGGFLSGGDLYHGVTSPQAVRWRHGRGLDTALLHVVHPDGDPQIDRSAWRLFAGGARSAGTGSEVVWRIHSWGTSQDGTLVDLGPAEIVSNRHPSVLAARRVPYWATRPGARWCDDQKAALRRAGFSVSRNLLGRGWRRYLVQVAAGDPLVIALPPDLPALPPRVLRVVSAVRNEFEELALPSRLVPRALASCSLVDLVRHFGAPR
jgi:hypothetical protein